ncbi:hypothetical protein SEA_SKOG_136 [Gordonia phage Skog]|uniref:Uncharacterized protein n=1 Tax=Gordonia phage Skog TaxID=2704033 RepID=A0A6G6XJL7_9CAUD|nr:hypothetical protein KHQ85_gp136 [Gordonia phage Skog]QIG58288.1 hypothetical protein SEA_SKOG_136 [Gordonia phage Skog]
MRLLKTPVRFPHWYRPIFVIHGPGVMLKEDVSWRNINGIAIRRGHVVYWWEWRVKK